MVAIGLAALAAAAASFPTGFGFGAGYGAGVRIGYDVIYPKIAPFAAKITDDILAAVDNLFGTTPVAQSSGTSGFAFAAGDKDRQQPFPPSSGGGRAGDAVNVTQPVSEGRLAGAGELKETVTNIGQTVTSPVTRTQLVHFKNYREAAHVVATTRVSSNRYTHHGQNLSQTGIIRQLSRSKQFIDDNNLWSMYLNWLRDNPIR